MLALSIIPRQAHCYLGRLIVLSPGNPLALMPGALTGFIVNPLWHMLRRLYLRVSAAMAGASAPTVA